MVRIPARSLAFRSLLAAITLAGLLWLLLAIPRDSSELNITMSELVAAGRRGQIDAMNVHDDGGFIVRFTDGSERRGHSSEDARNVLLQAGVDVAGIEPLNRGN